MSSNTKTWLFGKERGLQRWSKDKKGCRVSLSRTLQNLNLLLNHWSSSLNYSLLLFFFLVLGILTRREKCKSLLKIFFSTTREDAAEALSACTDGIRVLWEMPGILPVSSKCSTSRHSSIDYLLVREVVTGKQQSAVLLYPHPRLCVCFFIPAEVAIARFLTFRSLHLARATYTYRFRLTSMSLMENASFTGVSTDAASLLDSSHRLCSVLEWGIHFSSIIWVLSCLLLTVLRVPISRMTNFLKTGELLS